MPLQSTTELISPASQNELHPVAQIGHDPSDDPAETVSALVESQPEPVRYPALLERVCHALVDRDGYDSGLRKLDEDLRRRGPSQFARFYVEELLGRSPDSAAAARELVLSPSRRIRDILSSAEFMDQHDLVLQREFAHLSREFFFDIPQSGGTTIFEAFRSDPRFCPIQVFPGNGNGGFGPKLGYLRNTILRLANPRARHVLVFGHPSASRILSSQLKRGWDSAFTILRDPIDTCLSVVNSVLASLRKAPTHPDAVRWRHALELPDDLFLPDQHGALQLAPKIVELIAPENPMCAALGCESLLNSVLDNATILDLKIIRFEQLDDYIRFRGITRHHRISISTRYVEFSDLDRQTKLTMYDKNAQDMKFHDWVGRNMSPGDGPWSEL